MSQTEDRRYRVTWRSLPPASITPINSSGIEVLEERVVTAAYYRREGERDERYVFKRADGMPAFDVAVSLVETVEVLDDEDANEAATQAAYERAKTAGRSKLRMASA
jgi:hypothetical protein